MGDLNIEVQAQGLKTFEGNDYKLGLKDTEGKIILPASYDLIAEFYEGRALVRLGGLMDGKFGFINEQGKTVIPVNYEMAWDFRDGRAKV
eukprot:gene14234-17398_t